LIYHIAKEGAFLACLVGDVYEPASLREVGFVHCSSEAATIAVANEYFGGVEEKLLLLRVDPTKLTSQTRYEYAVPVDGIRAAAVPASTLFPHVYGPIEISAINGIGLLEREASAYIWPEVFAPMDAYLREAKRAG
jgi:uncharacterized protein (DUF952 family)